jgi:aldose 1-epimerase
MDGDFFVLEEPGLGSRAEIWPALGFNCVSWSVAAGGRPVDWLWSAADLLPNPRPTRSGIPILFPFPNRIRGGSFAWRGRVFQLPINDSQQRNAIHGFVCQRPWRVIDHGADQSSAWVHGRFQGSVDAQECRGFWPADYVLDAIYRLRGNSLHLQLTVTNPDTQDLPFGLGLHPYFRLAAEKAMVRTPPLERYLLADCLPTGERVPLEGQHLFLTQGRPLGNHEFDDLYAVLPMPNEHTPRVPALGKTAECVTLDISEATTSRSFRMTCEGGFNWLVVFTPPHRQALCVEPYTCVTDPFDTVSPGRPTGLQVLPAGSQWRGSVQWISNPGP